MQHIIVNKNTIKGRRRSRRPRSFVGQFKKDSGSYGELELMASDPV